VIRVGHHAAAVFATWTGLSSIARRVSRRQGSFVLELHGISSRHYPGIRDEVQPRLCAADLDRVLSWLASRFRFLTPGELLEGCRGGVLLTFDDGFANHERVVLPLLEKHFAPAVFFVTLQHVWDPRRWLPATCESVALEWGEPDRVPEGVAADLFDGMSVQQLRRCAESPLVTIGSHTLTHPFLTRCSDETLEYELVASREQLASLTGMKIDLLAYPTGDYDRRVAEAALRAGYQAAFAEKQCGVGLPLFEIPRVGVSQADSVYLAAKLSGLHTRPVRLRASAANHAGRGGP